MEPYGSIIFLGCMLTEQDLFQTGYTAFKAGDKPRAAAILAQLVQQYPRSERGWYLLGMCMDAADQREYCFRRVLEINPNNADAQKNLAFLSTPRPVVPVQPVQQPKVPAFLPENETEFEEFQETAPQPTSQQNTKKRPPQKRKQNTTLIVVSAILGICVLVVGVAIGFSMLSNRTVAPQPGNVSTATMQIDITPEATNTLLPPTPLPTALPTIAYEPRFEEAPCPFEAPRGVRVTCGFVTVPENRTSNSGRMLRLAVAKFHSTSSNPAPEPVLFLQGGPGGQAIQLAANGYSVFVEPFLGTRDYITFDQRGTGYSEPLMNCDELEKVHRQDIYGNVALETRELVYQNAFFSCGGLLQTQNIDLTAYSTVESAADVRDIVRLLGYEKVNLYGVSYGTRLALVTMRNHPEVVRSAILDSVVPVETNLVEEHPRSVNSALSQMFVSCAVDPNCARAYPDLATVFWDVVKELETNPVTLSTSDYPMGTVTETVDGVYLLSVILGSLRSPEFIITAPQTIYRVRDGDYSTLIAAQYSLPYEFDGISPGLYISTMCREHVLDSTPEELALISEQLGIEQFVFRPFYNDFGDMYSACKTWGSAGPNFGEKDAVVSDIPSLVIEGSFDPATPPFMGRQVSDTLKNSYYFEFSNMGHVPTGDDACARQVALEFLANPLVEPDRSCLNSIQPVEFLVPYTGEPPIELESERVSGLTVNVPSGWIRTEDDFFVRGNSAFDITQITAFRAGISVQDLVNYFSSELNGYRGFDSAPQAVGTRSANGYDWTLYTTSSNGRPADIAAASDGNQSLIVVMFSHPDEHDALYRTIFLPMVDSAR
jgi:pimeloyl-ACP methyl ester carboxylesterase